MRANDRLHSSISPSRVEQKTPARFWSNSMRQSLPVSRNQKWVRAAGAASVLVCGSVVRGSFMGRETEEPDYSPTASASVARGFAAARTGRKLFGGYVERLDVHGNIAQLVQHPAHLRTDHAHAVEQAFGPGIVAGGFQRKQVVIEVAHRLLHLPEI